MLEPHRPPVGTARQASDAEPRQEVGQDADGEGVVGEQPVIEPGGSYAYASGCPLGTDSGSMVGAYYMTDADGRSFEAQIPAFSLALMST